MQVLRLPVEGPLRIVIVDDSPVTRAMAKTAVNAWKGSAEAEIFVTAEDALAWANSNEADLLITDLMLPGMNGFELVTEVQALPAWTQVPCLVMTSHGEDHPGANSSKFRVIKKPIDFPAYMSALHILFETQSAA